MNDLREAAEMALDALHNIDQSNNYDAIEALRQALAQPEQEPVAWQDPQYKTLIEPHKAHPDWIPLYTAPPKREWVGLTVREITKIGNLDWDSAYVGIWYDFAKTIEAKLKEKNT